MKRPSSTSLAIGAATAASAAIILALAAGSAGAAMNNGGGLLPGQCVPSGSGYYFCNIGGKTVACNTDHPTDLPRDCPLSQRTKTYGLPNRTVGGTVKSN